MRVLHTSDWHLGRRLFNQTRHDEFEAFLTWLLETIETQKIDVLCVAGDIFNDKQPSATAQDLYYGFLAQLSRTCCQHAVIIGGNHDSGLLLNAPSSLLKRLAIHVVGNIDRDHPEREVIHCPGLGVFAAVPYLSTGDLQSFAPQEDFIQAATRYSLALEDHYRHILTLANAVRDQHSNDTQRLPLIVMGHLFAAGGSLIADDGVRPLFIGAEPKIPATIFGDTFDYVALGHLHQTQCVHNNPLIRYSGTPLPMSFGEGQEEKVVLIVDFDAKGQASITPLPIPQTKALVTLTGTPDDVVQALADYTETAGWLKIEITGTGLLTDAKRSEILEAINRTPLILTQLVNPDEIQRLTQLTSVHHETLDDLTPEEVFSILLEESPLAPKDDETRHVLKSTFQTLLTMHDEDEDETTS